MHLGSNVYCKEERSFSCRLVHLFSVLVMCLVLERGMKELVVSASSRKKRKIVLKSQHAILSVYVARAYGKQLWAVCLLELFPEKIYSRRNRNADQLTAFFLVWQRDCRGSLLHKCGCYASVGNAASGDLVNWTSVLPYNDISIWNKIASWDL